MCYSPLARSGRHSTPFGSWTPHAGPSFEPVYNLRFETNRPVRKRSGVRYALRYGEKIEARPRGVWPFTAARVPNRGPNGPGVAARYDRGKI